MAAMDRSVAWRAALLMAVAVAVIAVVLAATLDESFFRTWGWLAGPGVWAACALAVGRGAAAARGLDAARRARCPGCRASSPCSADVHWAGTPSALILFGLWCGWIAARDAREAGRLTRGGDRLMDLGLDGRVALVTGGSKGIGRAVAAALAAEGARVAIASRSAERIEAAAAEIGARGYVFDSEDLDAVPALLERCRRDLGPVDVYVANTGGPPGGPDPLAFTREQWEAAHRSLVLSPMAFLERLLPGMASRGWGRVVAIGSIAVREPIDALQLSNAHRPGLVAAFKVLARQLRGRRRDAQLPPPRPDRHRPRDRRRHARGGPGRRARDGPGGPARRTARRSPPPPRSSARRPRRTSRARACWSTAG